MADSPAIQVARAVAGGYIVQPNPVRSYLPPDYWRRAADYFITSVEYNTLALSAVAAPQTFQVQNDADFLVLGISAVEATTAAGTTEQTYWPVLIRIFDSGSGASWMDNPQHLHNVAGRGTVDAMGYRPLPYPRLVTAASAVTVELTNLEATARRIWISFHGVKIFFKARGS